MEWFEKKTDGEGGDNGDGGNAEFVPLRIEVALRYYQLIDFPFYIRKPSQEYVKITFQTRGLAGQLEGYRQRGLKEIYLTREDYEKMAVSLREELTAKKRLSGTFADLEQIHKQIRSQLSNIGMNRYDLMLAEEMSKITIERIQEVTSLTKLISNYRDKCSEEFLSYMALNFILVAMIDTFPWSTSKVKLKVGLACLFCDISLTPEDYEKMQKAVDAQNLPTNLRNHPIESAKMVYNADPTIPFEVTQLIEMHHELPDGSGYPAGLDHKRIPLLPSIFIVGNYFIERMRSVKFDADKVEEIMHEVYNKFNRGLFRQAIMALFKKFGFPELESSES